MKEEYKDLNSFDQDDQIDKIENVNPIKAIALIFLGVIGLSIVMTILYYISISILSMTGMTKEEFLSIENKLESILQFATYAIGCIIVIVILGIPTIKKIFEKFKFLEPYKNGLIMGLILIFAQSVYGAVTTYIFGNYSDNTNQMELIKQIKESPVLLGLATVLMGPIFEELTYRYSLFGLAYKKNRILAYVITILVFGFLHFDFKCFNSLETMKVEFINLPNYLISGGILCYAYEKNNSLISPIVAHIFNNGLAFLQIMLLF